MRTPLDPRTFQETVLPSRLTVGPTDTSVVCLFPTPLQGEGTECMRSWYTYTFLHSTRQRKWRMLQGGKVTIVGITQTSCLFRSSDVQRSPLAPADKRTAHDKTNLTCDSAGSHTQEMGAGSRAPMRRASCTWLTFSLRDPWRRSQFFYVRFLGRVWLSIYSLINFLIMLHSISLVNAFLFFCIISSKQVFGN